MTAPNLIFQSNKFPGAWLDGWTDRESGRLGPRTDPIGVFQGPKSKNPIGSFQGPKTNNIGAFQVGIFYNLRKNSLKCIKNKHILNA